MTGMVLRLVANWERKNRKLSARVKDSLVGLGLMEVLGVLAMACKGQL